MIKKLQVKFIILSMTSLLLLFAVVVSGINIVNYHSVIKEADELLMILSENKGTFPMRPPKETGNKMPPDRYMEMPYETRYFSVTLNSDAEESMHVDISHIVSVNETEAAALAQKVLEENSTGGFTDEFRYRVYVENETIRIIFVDCGRKLDSFRSFLLASIGVSVLGYAIVFLIIAFFSSRIIRPISESYEKQKRFITDAGHEIKTPLTIINADVDVLEMEIGENEWLQDIQKQAKRLAALTNDLVYLSRMEESADSMQMIEFPFSDVAGEAAASFQALAQTQGKEVLCSIQPMLSMCGNEKAIHQLVTILLDNALKYSPAGAVVSLKVEKKNKALILSVFNETEEPVRKEELHLLFERFYRMDASRNSRTGGYGIGLSLAKAIVTAHKGKIQAKTEDGHSLQIMAVFLI